jgi:hypothetical protein
MNHLISSKPNQVPQHHQQIFGSYKFIYLGIERCFCGWVAKDINIDWPNCILQITPTPISFGGGVDRATPSNFLGVACLFPTSKQLSHLVSLGNGRITSNIDFRGGLGWFKNTCFLK